MILGGGPGQELWPLTNTRAEPAVPFAGLFRLIDVPLSNCIHSGISNVYVLTQYNATSLNRQGTADAIRRYLYLLDEPKHEGCEDVLILSGDQLYRMDYTKLINYHRAKGADVTIATTPADEDHATHLGILSDLSVLEFHEKPPRTVLATMSIDTLEYGFAESEAEAQDKPFVASMGMYVFRRQVLKELLAKRFPKGELKIVAYPFHGYWEDVGNLKDYYAANMALAADARVLPPSKVVGATITDTLLGDACRVLQGSVVRNSVVGSCAYIEEDCFIQDSIIFGADTIDTAQERQEDFAANTVPLGIGRGSRLSRTIIDSNARIGRGCSLTNQQGVIDGSNSNLPKGVVIRDGILVVMRGAV
eukprot:gene1384-1724_t